ncbi:META domain-containing protein [Devosia sp.]|uniref:META domain-containing protein n=1 Tax=Devosia sp. TaxID=1871048 RepID=UPI002EF92366
MDLGTLRTIGRLALALLAAAAMAAPAVADPVTLSGQVTYRERIALPPNAVLRVQLIDVDATGAAPIRAEAPIAPGGQVPLTFTLSFDDRAINTAHSYALLAEIASGTAVWFRNTEPYALDPILPDPILIVTSFAGSAAATPPPPSRADAVDPAPILDVTWQAESIGGTPLLANSAATLSIAGDMRTGGRGGCNSYFTQAELAGENLRFSAVAATQMACAADAVTTQEQAFFAALAATRFWRLRDGKLVLLDGGGRELAVLAAAAR